ncbi:MAG: hypothetical protein JRN59_08140 [Nitrososphaerota archaeon]|nr:hypothetical protein [Nitrososphaerota archaeon]MDG6921484.1 hypothetical protein [Nitrososphaerota archaeon]
MAKVRYFSFGAGVAAFGAVVALISYYFLFSAPFAALGVACVILGSAAITLPESPVPSGAVRGVIHASVMNVEALLEEFDAREKGVYLPPKDGESVAYVPLASNPHLPSVASLVAAPRRLVSEADGVPVLMVVPPGSELVRASELSEASGLEDAIQYVLTEVTELCSSAKAVVAGDKLVVEMKGIKVKTEAAKYLVTMGSIPASIAASVAAAVLQKGVALVSEDAKGKDSTATFGVL